MFYVVYNTQSGNVVDITLDLPSAMPLDYTIMAFDMPIPDLFYYKWDPTTLSFICKSNISRQLTVYQFLNRFTAQERITIKTVAATNAALSDYMDMLNSSSFVDPDCPEVYGGLYFLALNGLISQDRIPEILA